MATATFLLQSFKKPWTFLGPTAGEVLALIPTVFSLTRRPSRNLRNQLSGLKLAF